MKTLKDENIVNLIDVYFTKNNVYIIQEYCNGGDLRHYMKQSKGPVDEAKARKILNHIILGMKQLVKLGIIHRDLKPENILIHNNQFKIADFGFVN